MSSLASIAANLKAQDAEASESALRRFSALLSKGTHERHHSKVRNIFFTGDSRTFCDEATLSRDAQGHAAHARDGQDARGPACHLRAHCTPTRAAWRAIPTFHSLRPRASASHSWLVAVQAHGSACHVQVHAHMHACACRALQMISNFATPARCECVSEARPTRSPHHLAALPAVAPPRQDA